jgi:cysteine desulfurase family protein (TIGR01976 family)
VTYDVDRLRARIPALRGGVAYFDGPGGTQTPDVVADAIASALVCGISNRGQVTQSERNADALTNEARDAVADLVNGDPHGVVFGRSATSLTFEVARTLAQDWGPGDEIVVTRLDHDANVRPWVTYAERSGATIRWAAFDPDSGTLEVETIAALVNENTRVVAVTGASNLIGTRPDLAAISEIVHGFEALLYVDGVHLTAHAPIDVEEIGADFFVCSPYKFLGPHNAMLIASPALLETLHPDKLRPSTETVPERFELGTLQYELLAGVITAIEVIADLVPGDEVTMSRRARIVRSMQALEEYEDDLHAHMRAGLESLRGVELFSNAAKRTPTELFRLKGVDPQEVYRELANQGINAPAGSFYAIEAAEHLGLGAAGAVRVGLAPYSSYEEVDRLINCLEELWGR